MVSHFTEETTVLKDGSFSEELGILREIAAEDDVPLSGNRDTVRELEPPPAKKPEKDDSDGGRECVICMAQRRSVLLLPCKHLCVCSTCSASVTACPLCRETISSKTSVFL